MAPTILPANKLSSTRGIILVGQFEQFSHQMYDDAAILSFYDINSASAWRRGGREAGREGKGEVGYAFVAANTAWNTADRERDGMRQWEGGGEAEGESLHKENPESP